MCKVSKYQLGALISQSFVERVNLKVNLIVTKNIKCLKYTTLEKLVVLKMKQLFMEKCCLKRPANIIHLAEQQAMYGM